MTILRKIWCVSPIFTLILLLIMLIESIYPIKGLMDNMLGFMSPIIAKTIACLGILGIVKFTEHIGN